MILCRTLGPPEVTLDGAPAPPELTWRKNLALLVYLARSPRHTRSREHLLGLLWPDSPEGAARHSLNVALGHLRRLGGDGIVMTDGGKIRLAGNQVELDVDRFEHLRGMEDFSGAAALVFGQFLEGLTLDAGSDFEDWLSAERGLWKERCIDALCAASEAELATGRTAGALDFARRAIALDGRAEQAVRSAMRALALSGRSAEAQAEFDAFAERVGGRTAADPVTLALAERIGKGRRSHEPPRPGTPATSDTRRTPLVGREAELAELYGAWVAGRAARKAALLVVEGDAGMGKSRLAQELEARVGLDGGTVVGLRAVAGDLEIPHSGIDGIAEGGLLDVRGAAAASPGSLAALAARSAAWADRFGDVVRGIAPAPLTRALSDVLRAAADEAPLMLLVDDAQWLDRDSTKAIASALRDLGSYPFTVMFCLTPHAPRDDINEMRGRIGRDLQGTSVGLPPLSPQALRSLAGWAVPTYDADQLDRLARRLAFDSAGVPLLASELLNGVVLGLDLKGSPNAWPEPQRTLDQTLPGELPDAIVAAVRAGFWRLSQAAQRALTVAALLPDRIHPGALAQCAGLATADLHQALDELEWQRWLVADARGYTFVARVVRLIVAQDMLTEGQRQRIQASIASHQDARGN